MKGIGELLPSAASAITSAIGGIRTAITGQLPPDKAAEVSIKLQEAENAVLSMQSEVNKVEAASSSVFVAGWRPFLGWVLGVSVAFYYVPRFVVGIALWTIQVVKTGVLTIPPEMGIQDVIGLLVGMLGLGTLRTWEKTQGVQGRH